MRSADRGADPNPEKVPLPTPEVLASMTAAQRDVLAAERRRYRRRRSVEQQLVVWIEDVQASLDSGHTTQLRRGGITLAVRRGGPHWLNGLKTLDIAYVTMNERLRSRGWFTRFIDFAETVNPWHGLNIEWVQNPRLAEWFKRNGWHELPGRTVDEPTRTVCGYTTSFSPFMIAEAEVAPVVTALSLTGDPVPVNTATTLQATFTDANPGDTHTGSFSWGSGTGSGNIAEANGAGTLTLAQAFASPGVYTVTAFVSDGNLSGSRSSALDIPAYVVVYDPTGSFGTGGGWIASPAGACRYGACAEATTGTATFGFVSKYKPGASVPSGTTEFQFKAGGFHFKSAGYDWLVVAGARAQFKGIGTVNGGGTYRFLLTAIDGDVSGGGGADRFRIKIWEAGSGTVVYDNQMDQDETGDASTVLGGGSIQIHK